MCGCHPEQKIFHHSGSWNSIVSAAKPHNRSRETPLEAKDDISVSRSREPRYFMVVEDGIRMKNAVQQEPVPTRVLNPNASEASYKPKQHSYRKMKLIFFSGGILSGKQ